MSNKSFWLRNLIVLGQGAPNRIRKLKGRQGRCICVWSEEIGFCRLYPIPYGYLGDWNIMDACVRYPTRDGRKNTFVIYNYEKEWPNLNKRIIVHKTSTRRVYPFKTEKDRKNRLKIAKEDWIPLVERLAKESSVSKIQDKNESFGVVEPLKMELKLEENKKSATAQYRLTLFCKDIERLDETIMDQKDYAWIPYLWYWCKNKCSISHPHKQKIVEWGAYRWMKKNPNSREHCEKLKENFHIGDPEWKHYLLIGNLKKHPKSYIIVKIIRFKIQ